MMSAGEPGRSVPRSTSPADQAGIVVQPRHASSSGTAWSAPIGVPPASRVTAARMAAIGACGPLGTSELWRVGIPRSAAIANGMNRSMRGTPNAASQSLR